MASSTSSLHQIYSSYKYVQNHDQGKLFIDTLDEDEDEDEDKDKDEDEDEDEDE